MNSDSFGLYLYELRRRRGLSQKRLGELLGLSGKAVSKWECGLSMPQSGILPKLADVLNVSLDDLLFCGWEDNRKGTNRMKTEFWNRVDSALHEKYGETPPLTVVNRLETERNELQSPSYYFAMQVLRELKELADSTGHRFSIYGYRTSAFALYLLGLHPVNPLPAHYYCPKCRTLEFVPEYTDGYDLPPKTCTCGTAMDRDGHSIPPDVTIQLPEYYGILSDCQFRETATEFFRNYPGAAETPLINNANEFPFAFRNPVVYLRAIAQPVREAMYLLEQATNTSADRIDYLAPDVLEHLLNADCEGLPDMGLRFSRQVIETSKPQNFAQLAKITGFTHAIGLWLDNGIDLLKAGIPLDQLISCREDIYCTVRDAMIRRGCTDYGFAVTVTDHARRGSYLKNGMSESVRAALLELEIPEWFIDSMCKGKYIFPKSDSIRYTRDSMIYQWYKLRYPEAFHEVMKVYDEMLSHR